MCVLLYKPFVLGYLAAAIILQVLIYFKRIILIPRGLDGGVMVMFLAAFFMSQRLVLRGSLGLRLIILLGLGIFFYGGSKLIFPGQYKSLLKLKEPEEFLDLLEEGEEFEEKKEVFKLKKGTSSKKRINEHLRKTSKPIFELLMALFLGGVFVYFLIN